MNITRLMTPTLIAVATLCSVAHAAPALADDPVTASFQRMLAHQPGPSAAIVPNSLGEDPLRVGVNAVFWEKQQPSVHLAGNTIGIAPCPAPQR